jgi:hypothetical protein
MVRVSLILLPLLRWLLLLFYRWVEQCVFSVMRNKGQKNSHN